MSTHKDLIVKTTMDKAKKENITVQNEYVPDEGRLEEVGLRTLTDQVINYSVTGDSSNILGHIIGSCTNPIFAVNEKGVDMEGAVIINGKDWLFSATGVTAKDRWPVPRKPKKPIRNIYNTLLMIALQSDPRTIEPDKGMIFWLDGVMYILIDMDYGYLELFGHYIHKPEFHPGKNIR